MYRIAGHLAGRILNRAKPGELPIERPTRLEFVLNLKTARMLSLVIPPALLRTRSSALEAPSDVVRAVPRSISSRLDLQLQRSPPKTTSELWCPAAALERMTGSCVRRREKP